jgi:hypothetical protein
MRARELSSLKLRVWSQERLIGATLGGYLILTAVLFFWGDLLVRPDFPSPGGWGSYTPPEYQFKALMLLVPGAVVALFSVLQIRFGLAISQRLTNLFAWLNFLAVLGLGVSIAMMNDVGFEIGGIVGVRLAIVCFPLGLILASLNVMGRVFSVLAFQLRRSHR